MGLLATALIEESHFNMLTLLNRFNFFNYYLYKKATDKSSLMLKAEEQVKKYLKPLFLRKLVSKENYKIIMRKCVEKIYNKAKIRCTIHDNNVLKLVQDYVKRYENH